MTEIHFDFEFLNTGDRIWPISIGMVREDGTTYYGINADVPYHEVRDHHFLGKEVWPLLPKTDNGHFDFDHPDVKSEAQLRSDILRFICDTDRPSMWGWFTAHDYVLLARFFGLWPEISPSIPQRANDVAQEWERLGYPPMPEQPSGHHHPLEDARFCLFRRFWLKEYEKQMRERQAAPPW